MLPKTCSIPECGTKFYARGWCAKHYKRWLVYGDPTFIQTPAFRFMRNVTKSDGCWEWTAHRMETGYASFYADGKYQLVHRFSYEMHIGPIPSGMQVDHICHNTSCVNPDHLRAVTPKQNCENLSGPTSRSKTGIRGVTWAKHAGKWLVRVGHHGKPHHGGYFTDINEAEQVAIALRNRLFTHNDLDRTHNAL